MTIEANDPDIQTAKVTPDIISFRRRGDIMRGDIRVGWVQKQDDTPPIRWQVRFTPASGIPGIHGDYSQLRDAKTAARMALEAVQHAR